MNGHCPVCVESKLVERTRDGVQIDVCASCRGIWLDRGELEKLISLDNQELSDDRLRDSEPPSSRRGYSRTQPHRKRGLLASLGDLFD